jgi:hypothetical protein
VLRQKKNNVFNNFTNFFLARLMQSKDKKHFICWMGNQFARESLAVASRNVPEINFVFLEQQVSALIGPNPLYQLSLGAAVCVTRGAHYGVSAEKKSGD